MTAPPPRQFAQVMVEILAGVRSPGQIVPWTTDRARAQMRCLAPLLTSDRRPRIQRIVTSRPTAGAVEMTVIVSLGPRSRALALRLEHMAARPAVPGVPARPARWLCTEIEAGLPGEGPLGVRAHPRVSVAALELAARPARTRVVAPDAGEVVARRGAAAGLHVGPAVEGRRSILELLSAPRRKAGRQGGRLARLWPRVSSTGPGPLGSLGRLGPLARLGSCALLACLGSLTPLSLLASPAWLAAAARLATLASPAV